MTFFSLHYSYILFFLIPLMLFLHYLYIKKFTFLLQIYTMQFVRHHKLHWILFIKLFLVFAMVVGILLYFFNLMNNPMSRLMSGEKSGHTSHVHIVLDVSLSMYVRERKQTRMFEAVKIIRDTVNTIIENNSQAQFAFSVFTDTVVKVIPFSKDVSFLFNVLDSIVQKPLIQGSSDLMNMFSQLEKNHNASHETLIVSEVYDTLLLLSDWESHTKVNAQHVRSLRTLYNEMFFVIVGTENVRPVIDMNSKYIKDEEGNFAYSQAQPAVAKKVAKVLNATYVDSDTPLDLYNVAGSSTHYVSLFWLINVFLALLLLGYILLEQ